MTHVQRRFGFARMLDEYRTLLYPAASQSTPGVESEHLIGADVPDFPIGDRR
jgi:hypothetical protein